MWIVFVSVCIWELSYIFLLKRKSIFAFMMIDKTIRFVSMAACGQIKSKMKGYQTTSNNQSFNRYLKRMSNSNNKSMNNINAVYTVMYTAANIVLQQCQSYCNAKTKVKCFIITLFKWFWKLKRLFASIALQRLNDDYVSLILILF